MSEDPFAHIPLEFRAKVMRDLLSHLKADEREWDYARFNPLNDYQRHLYGLFLRTAGKDQQEVSRAIYDIATDVEPRKRISYVSDVIHSAIVGFPQADGTLIAIPSQIA